MDFKLDKVSADGPTVLVAEHELMVAWITKNPHSGVIEYIRERLIDENRKIALYYIQAWGMGECQCFAIVQHNQIIRFDVTRSVLEPNSNIQGINIGEIIIPEKMDEQRHQLKLLITEAVTAYNAALPFAIWVPTDVVVNFEKVRWVLVPKKNSILYWRTKATKWWVEHKLILTKVRFFAKSPLFALLALLVLICARLQGMTTPIWLVVLCGGWFCLRLTQYDDDYRYWPWLVGRVKFKNARLAYAIAGVRNWEPKLLSALLVTLHKAPPGVKNHLIEVKNTTPFLASHFQISHTHISDLVAPGYVDALRAKNNGPLIGEEIKELESKYPTVRVRWILPFQTIRQLVPVHEGYPFMHEPKTLEVGMAISKLVSGEAKSLWFTYLLPVSIKSV